MTARDKVNQLIETIKSGKTVYISTATRCVKITPKTLARWEKSGHKLLTADDKSMFLASGKKFDCIDFCKITVEG